MHKPAFVIFLAWRKWPKFATLGLAALLYTFVLWLGKQLGVDLNLARNFSILIMLWCALVCHLSYMALEQWLFSKKLIDAPAPLRWKVLLGTAIVLIISAALWDAYSAQNSGQIPFVELRPPPDTDAKYEAEYHARLHEPRAAKITRSTASRP